MWRMRTLSRKPPTARILARFFFCSSVRAAADFAMPVHRQYGPSIHRESFSSRPADPSRSDIAAPPLGAGFCSNTDRQRVNRHGIDSRRGAGQHSTVEERAVVVRAVPLNQHRSDEPAIGSSVNDNSLGLAEAIDEILACLIGIVGGLLHAKSEIPISRSNPGVAEP